jgi:hypothetical protein
MKNKTRAAESLAPTHRVATRASAPAITVKTAGHAWKSLYEQCLSSFTHVLYKQQLIL